MPCWVRRAYSHPFLLSSASEANGADQGKQEAKHAVLSTPRNLRFGTPPKLGGDDLSDEPPSSGVPAVGIIPIRDLHNVGA